MMNSAKNQETNNPPKPGDTITYLEGEILSVKKSKKGGMYGKLSTKFGIYDYILKDSSSLANNVLVGLRLIINKGYCFENKQSEHVISDGKFGNIKTEIDMNQFYSFTEKGIIITGKMIEINQCNGISTLKLELLFPPYTYQEIRLSSNFSAYDVDSKRIKDLIAGKAVKIKGSGSYSELEVKDIEILPQNHFLNMITKIKNDNLETFTSFNHIILNQIQLVENFHNSFKNTLINMGKKISKTLLTELKEVLQNKIFDGSVKFPYNTLIPLTDIDEYFSTMLTFLRNIISSEGASNNPEDLVTILKYYYPAYSCKNIVN
jgi:hypothetical protein